MKSVFLSSALILALAANSHAAAPKSFEARVIGVSDGDTITVQVSETPPYRIRLAGIDAPEKRQPFNDRSKQNLSRLAYRQTVRVEWTRTDKYGRIVGKVYVGKLDVNLAQVAAGFAWHYRQFEGEQSKRDRETYALAERNARQKKLGLWKDASPQPPWEWRRKKTATPGG